MLNKLFQGFLSQLTLKNRLIFSFNKIFGRCQHAVEKYFASCLHIMKDGIGNLEGLYSL
jgi:hypothetical protein